MDNARRFAIAWVILVISVAIHVADEALSGFLRVYNPTVLELRHRVPWVRPPTFTFETWITGLIAAICVALLLTPLAFRAPRVFRPIAIVMAVLMLLNGCSHIAGTILGHTFNDIQFPRPMPGTYSSPVMITAAVYLIIISRRPASA